MIGGSGSLNAVAGHVSTQLTALTGLRGCRYESGRYGGLPRLEEDGHIRTTGKEWDLDQFGMPDTDVELLGVNERHAFGRFVLQPTAGVTPPLLARRISSLLARQVAAAYSGRMRSV